MRLGGNENVPVRLPHELGEFRKEFGKTPFLDRDDRDIARKRSPGAGSRRGADERGLRKTRGSLGQAVGAHRGVGRKIVSQDGDSHDNRRRASTVSRGTTYASAGQSSTSPCAMRTRAAATWKPSRDASSTSGRRIP